MLRAANNFECLGAHVPAEAEDTAVGLVRCGGDHGMEAGRAPTVRASGSGSGAGWWESHSGTCFVGRPQTTRHSALLNTASSVVKLEKKKKKKESTKMNYLFKVVDDNLCDVCAHTFPRTGSVFTNWLPEAISWNLPWITRISASATRWESISHPYL